MNDLVMSKKTFANIKTATAAAAKDARATGALATLPSGRICYMIAVTFA